MEGRLKVFLENLKKGEILVFRQDSSKPLFGNCSLPEGLNMWRAGGIVYPVQNLGRSPF